MEDKMEDKLVSEYAPRLKELLPLARKAYGCRSTISPQHDASREYTRLLVEYYNKGGSLIAISEAVGVTYAGVRRRVTTVDIAPSTKRTRSKATPEQVAEAAELVEVVLLGRELGDRAASLVEALLEIGEILGGGLVPGLRGGEVLREFVGLAAGPGVDRPAGAPEDVEGGFGEIV